MTQTVRIGTRGSLLARWQAQHVCNLLQARHPGLTIEVVVIRTLGDHDRATPLAQLGGTGVFTKEIESALLDDRCDLAVHSLKDLPTALAPEFMLAAVLPREDPRDALIAPGSSGLDTLPEGATVGTSSLRRRSQLLALRPDLQLADLRGNLPTRLRAVGCPVTGGARPQEPLDATLLALAGLRRLGLDLHVTEILDPDRFLPAPAQGAIGVEIRAGDGATPRLVAAIDDRPSRRATMAERAFLNAFEGGCKVPIGALARTEQTDLDLEVVVGDLDGRRQLRDRARGRDPVALGNQLAARIRARGGDAILATIREGTAR